MLETRDRQEIICGSQSQGIVNRLGIHLNRVRRAQGRMNKLYTLV